MSEESHDEHELHHSVFFRLRKHLEGLIQASGGGEKVLDDVLARFDKLLKGPASTALILTAAVEMLTLLEKAYAAKQGQLEAEVKALDAKAQALTAAEALRGVEGQLPPPAEVVTPKLDDIA